VLRSNRQDLAVDQLDPLVRIEELVVDHALVLHPGPSARLDIARLCRVHEASCVEYGTARERDSWRLTGESVAIATR